MVRPRRRVSLACAVSVVLLVSAADTEQAAKPAPDSKPAPAARKKPVAPAEPLDRRPYRIRAWVSVDPGARIDSVGKQRLVTAWTDLVRRFVGAPWELKVAEDDGPLLIETLDTLQVKAVEPLAKEVDKAWAIRVEADGPGLRFSGREFDTLTRRLGPIFQRSAPFRNDLTRPMLQLALDLFEPVAEIGAKTGGGVLLTVRGGSLEPASPIGAVVKVNTVFRPLRIWMKGDGTTLRIDDIRRSFLRVNAVEGTQARCDIVSAMGDPLTNRTGSRNKLVALGVKPSDSPTTFRYVLGEDRSPAEGYLMTVHNYPNGPPIEVGMTDREGKLVLEPGYASGLVVFRLMAADIEPLDEFPAMPGVTLSERPIAINPKLDTVALFAKLNSLRDELVDQVAIRARIESRLKARVDGEKWDEAEELIAEYRKLPRRDDFVKRLEKLREDAQARQDETKKAVLTRRALNLFTDTQALIDRYLDDELFRAYAEGIATAKAEGGAAKPKLPIAKKGPGPPPARAAAPPAAQPAPRPAAGAQPQPAAPPPTPPKRAGGVVPF